MAFELDALRGYLVGVDFHVPPEDVDEYFALMRKVGLAQVIDLALLDDEDVVAVVGGVPRLVLAGTSLRDVASSFRSGWAKLACMDLSTSSSSSTPSTCATLPLCPTTTSANTSPVSSV